MSKPKLDQAARDAALLELYRRLKARSPVTSFTGLSAEDRRDYFRVAKQRSRKRMRDAAAAGAVEPTLGNVRDALADAALMILATGAPGVDQVRKVLGGVFARRPGAPMSIEQRAKSGKLRPRLAARARP